MNPTDLKRGIDKAVNAVVEELKELSRPCTTRKEIAQVGANSVNLDSAIGDIIAQAMGKVGAATDVEMTEKRDGVEDALHATPAAVEEGIVPGGSVALLRGRAAIQAIKGDNHDQEAGITIVLHALEQPLRAIAANAGMSVRWW